MVVEVLGAQSEGEVPLGEQRLLVVDGEEGIASVGDHRVEGIEADAVGDLADSTTASVVKRPSGWATGCWGRG